jgi:hypothetical protein
MQPGVGIRWCVSMPGIALVRSTATPLPARQQARREVPPVEPEHIEEVWDAELVSELPPPGWLAVPALSTYLRAGHRAPAPRIDVFA